MLNWDLRKDKFAEFGKGESLLYTGILLAALALEKNEAEFNSLLTVLNRQKYAPGMYPRYRGIFDTSKDPYYQLLVGLVYGQRSFPQNSHIKETIDEIIQGVRESGYFLKNPDGSKTSFGNMIGFLPLFRCIEGKAAYSYYFALALFPVYAFIRHLFYDAKYFNLLMMGSHYLIYHLHRKGSRERLFLRLSVNLFALVERRNPYFLMIRDLIFGSQKHRRKVEDILYLFPESHLPDDEEPIAHFDVLWQRDPRTWKNHLSQLRYEYSGVDFLALYQFYSMHYQSGHTVLK